MVHFTDKNGNGFTIDNPQAFLSTKAIDRRSRQGIEINEEDLPVSDVYLDSIAKLGVSPFFVTKWFNAALVECDASKAAELETISFIDQVEYVAPGSKIGTIQKTKKPLEWGFRTGRKKAAATALQNEMLGVDILHDRGFTGEGISIAILDGGFTNADDIDFFDHLYSEGKVKYTLDYVTGDENVYRYTEHGTRVFSILGAYDPDEYVGVAYDADFFLFVTEDDCNECEHRVEEYNWLFAAEFADSAGVDVINSSLGYNIFEDPDMSYTYEDMDGQTTVISRAAEIASAKGMIVVSSAGNEGNLPWKHITAPADAASIVSVGGVNSEGVKISSSSFGPTSDDRTKPEFVALGALVKVVNQNGFVVGASGTSFSSPLVAGLLATTWQAYPELTAQELIGTYKETATNAASPDNETGYGIPNFQELDFVLSVDEVEEAFMIFPNPVDQNRINIRAQNTLRKHQVQATIFDTSGKSILNESIGMTSSGEGHLEISFLKSGIYILQLDTGSKIHSFRLVKI